MKLDELMLFLLEPPLTEKAFIVPASAERTTKLHRS